MKQLIVLLLLMFLTACGGSGEAEAEAESITGGGPIGPVVPGGGTTIDSSGQIEELVEPGVVVPGNRGGLFVVEDALGQFDRLKHHAEALGWLNPENLGAPDPSLLEHYQGLVRNPRPGPAIFYISQLETDGGGYLHIVRLASRSQSGERLRSNLQQIGNDTEEASPPTNDTWVRSIRFDGTPVFDGTQLSAYKHPGSMALVDDVLIVPVDQPIANGAPMGQLLLFDVSSNAISPSPLQALPLSHGIDNVAVTRRENGLYRIWMNGNSGNSINVYDSTTTDLRSDNLDLVLIQSWRPSADLLGSHEWPTGQEAHQSSTFVREASGDLYLIALRGTTVLFDPRLGSDFGDIYKVDESNPEVLRLTHLRTREFNCVYDGGGGPRDMRVCAMIAAGTAYVSPSGELLLYSMPHDDEDGFEVDIARLGEFRHRDVSRESSSLRLATEERPWVELYDDEGFRDRSIVVDYDDRFLLELDDFNNLDDFSDKPSSVRWRSPIGLDIALYDDDNFRDRYILLRGTGQTESITNLNSQTVETGLVEQFDPAKGEGERLDFNDKTTSLMWLESDREN